MPPVHQPELQRLDDGARDLVLDGEDVLELPVVGLGPELVAVLDVHELGRDADAVPDLAHAALEHGRHAELLADLPDVHVLPPLNAKDDVRDATCMPGTFASALMISSVIPSLKYSFSGSALMLASGSTAIAFGAMAPLTSGGVRFVPVSPPRRMARRASANSAPVRNRSTGVGQGACHGIVHGLGHVTRHANLGNRRDEPLRDDRLRRGPGEGRLARSASRTARSRASRRRSAP